MHRRLLLAVLALAAPLPALAQGHGHAHAAGPNGGKIPECNEENGAVVTDAQCPAPG